MVSAFLRPDADSVDGGWVNESAVNTNLYASLNETSPADADFIRSNDNPDHDICVVRLSDPGGAVSAPMVVRYRYNKVGTNVLSLIVRLKEGASPSTAIAEWPHTGIGDTPVTAEQTLTTGQFNAISDFTDLYLEFEAITGALTGAASALLAGETEGFAIDATTAGGSVAVIDTGTPANDLNDVALDASNLTNSSTSAKLVPWNSSPYLRWSPHNMFVNSGSPATQSVTVVTGRVYTVTVTGSGSLAGSSGASGTATAGSPVTFTATGATATWTLTGSLTTIQMNRGYIATPYLATGAAARYGIPQAYDVAADKFGILIEPSAINICLNSRDFSATWAQTDTTRTSTDNAAPDDSATATLMTEGTAGTATNGQAKTITANATYTCSIFLKKGNADWCRLGLYETATPANRIDNWFNLNTGEMGTPANGGTGTGAKGKIKDIGNGWYRCVLTGAVGNSATGVTFDMSSASADASATRVNGATYYAWGGQLQTGLIVTSHIPTIGSSVTAAADRIQATISSLPWSDAEGTIYMQFKSYLGPGGYMWEVFLDNSNRISLRNNASGVVSIANRTANTEDVASNIGTVAEETIGQATYAFKTNDFDGVLDAGGLTSDNAGTLTTGYSSFGIGNRGGGESYLNGYMYRIIYVPYQRQTASGDLATWRYNF